MPIRRLLMPLVLVPLVLASLVSMTFAQAPSEAVSLVILHTNDTHGHLMPFSYPTIVPAGSELAALPARSNIGGIARRAALAAKVRAEVSKAGGTTWLVDVGDFTDGTPFSTEYKGEADVAAMNAAGYQFGTVGNHEFNMKPEDLSVLLTRPIYPLLVANATMKESGAPLLPPYRIEKIGDLRVAVFGLITKSVQGYPAARNRVVIGDEVDVARVLVPKLRKEADIVILLSHCGLDVDERMAAEVPGIDVIVGGHSHSRIPTGEFVWRSDELEADSVNGTVIVQNHQWGGELGRLDLLVTRSGSGVWHVSRYRSRMLPITSDMTENPEVAAVVEKYWKPIAGRYGTVVGTAAGDFSSRGDDDTPYALVADAVRETFKTDFELENEGGVRAPLVAGPITYGDLVTVDPFNNTVVLFEATGAKIRDLLTKNLPFVSGLRYQAVDGVLTTVTINGQPLQDDKVYTGATNSYFAGYALKGVTVKETGRARLDVVAEYIRSQGTVKPAYDGRRILIGKRSACHQ
jgi:5'-nucleotidase/UDP-sugar diphosphatase